VKKHTTVILLLIVAALVLSANIWGYSIYLLDEAKNAECAREMLETGNWVVPTFNYELRSDKPPLHYYFMALAYSVFGVNEFAARFFSMVFGLLTLLSVYYFTCQHLGQKVAKYSTIVLLSSIGFIVQFHLAVPDPYLVFFVTASIFSFYRGYKKERPGWLYFSYTSMGLAVLTKGPVGLVLPLLSIIVFLVFKKQLNFGAASKLKAWPGGLMFLVITIPWYWLVYQQTDGAWFQSFFVEHNVERFLSPKEGHGGLFLITPLYLLIMTLPLGLFIFPAIKSIWNERGNDLTLLSLILIVVVVIVFSISATKLPNYVSPALPFVAIVIGNYLAERHQVLLADKIIFALFLIMSLTPVSSIILDVDLESISLNKFWPLYLITLGGVLGVVFCWKNNLDKALWSVASTFVLAIVLLFYTAIPVMDQQNPVQQSMNDIESNNNIAAFHIFNPSFSFYLKRPVHVFENIDDLQQFIHTQDSVIVLTRRSVLPELAPLNLDTLKIRKDLFESTSTVVLRKRYQ